MQQPVVAAGDRPEAPREALEESQAGRGKQPDPDAERLEGRLDRPERLGGRRGHEEAPAAAGRRRHRSEGDGQLRGHAGQEFLQLPMQNYVVDISCVTKWTHLDMKWEGVSLDTLLEHVELDHNAMFVTAYSDGGHTTNMPLTDIVNGQSFIALKYDGKPLAPEHGGPARMVVPHLYFWKSAKWVRGIHLMEKDKPGFWESAGYHNRGDPWKEQRYWND